MFFSKILGIIIENLEGLEYKRDSAVIGGTMLFFALVSSFMSPLIALYLTLFNIQISLAAALIFPLFFLTMFSVIAMAEAIPEIKKLWNTEYNIF